MPSLASWQRAWAEKARRDPADPHAWAMARRVIAGRPPARVPALEAIARDRSRLVVIQKSAQVGATELLVNLALWAADTGHTGRGNALFLMPTQNVMDDFAQARFDRAIQDSAYLRGRLQPEPPRRKGADSKRLKRVGTGYIFLRGADSPRQIASVDADLVVLDEYDQMADGALELAEKRIASSRDGRIIVASTPRYPEAGVNRLFLASDQHHYWLPCQACGTEQSLRWPENIDFERALVACASCRAPLDVTVPGRWVTEAPGNAIRGYHLSRLYSPWADIPAMIAASQSPTPRGQQEFQNSDLGEAFVMEGGGLSLATLDSCRQDYALQEYAGEPCVMGVDVGTRLHVVIREYGDRHRADPALPRRLWYADTVATFEELDVLIERFDVASTVIDALPEVHKVGEFVRRHALTARVAWYGRQDAGVESVPEQDGRPAGLRLNRVEALERTFERFRAGLAALPGDARQLGGRLKYAHGEYYRELLALQRTLEQDAHGNWQARWSDRGLPDHFAHAETYCSYAEEIAQGPVADLGQVMAGLEWNSPWSDYSGQPERENWSEFARW